MISDGIATDDKLNDIVDLCFNLVEATNVYGDPDVKAATRQLIWVVGRQITRHNATYCEAAQEDRRPVEAACPA